MPDQTSFACQEDYFKAELQKQTCKKSLTTVLGKIGHSAGRFKEPRYQNTSESFCLLEDH